jgi:predicted dithiol-disulfide oxidoreductase (DUF899 family)
MTTEAPIKHNVVSQDEWIAASRAHLVKEKELTHHREDVARLRRELPWVKVEKDYVFEGPDGKHPLSDLFDGRSQLIVYHMMYGPNDTDGCPGCSFISDHVDSARQHFEHDDLSFVAISRAPLANFAPFKKKMGWTFKWLSSAGNEFNYDFGVSYRPADYGKGPVLHNFTMQKLSSEEQPGLTAFYKDAEGNIFRTYSTYERGLDALLGAYQFLDLTPKGRNEKHAMSWVNYHDRYED